MTACRNSDTPRFPFSGFFFCFEEGIMRVACSVFLLCVLFAHPAYVCGSNRVSLDIRVPSGRITDILNGRRAIAADTAVRLGRYFGNSRQFWLDLQGQFDIAVVERERGVE